MGKVYTWTKNKCSGSGRSITSVMWLFSELRQPREIGSAWFSMEGTKIGDKARLEHDKAIETWEMEVLQEALRDLPFQKAPMTPELSLWTITSAS